MDEIYYDMRKKLGIIGIFVLSLRDNRTQFVRFKLESDMLMALSWDANTITDTAFKVYRWKHCSECDFDAVVAPVWVALPRRPEHC